VTETEKKLCLAIKDKLIEDGLYFVGIDVIGDKLVEINCVSPGGIPRINRLDGVKLESDVIDFIERKVTGPKLSDSHESDQVNIKTGHLF
jgi:glutathione synthase